MQGGRPKGRVAWLEEEEEEILDKGFRFHFFILESNFIPFMNFIVHRNLTYGFENYELMFVRNLWL